MPFDGFLSAPVPVQTHPARAWLERLRDSVRVRSFQYDAAEPSPVSLLRGARDVIADEGRWAQGRYSTLDGRHCAVGALRVVTRDVLARRAGKRAHAALRGVALEAGFGSVEQMNDRWTHAEVLGAFDRAITAAGRQAAART